MTMKDECGHNSKVLRNETMYMEVQLIHYTCYELDYIRLSPFS